MLNVAGALRLAEWFAQPTTALDTLDMIEGEPVTWSRQLIWGNFRITGGVPLPGANAWDLTTAWGATRPSRGAGAIVWGARTLDGDVTVEAQDDTLVLAPDTVVTATNGRRNIVWATGDRRNIVWATGDRRNIVWATGDRRNIVWATGDHRETVWTTSGRRNIVWATGDRRNIVWATALGENVVWADDCGGNDCAQVWGAAGADGVWGTAEPGAAIFWAIPEGAVEGANGRRNIVWATGGRRNIVWATGDRRNIVWATGEGQGVVWGASAPLPVVWPAKP